MIVNVFVVKEDIYLGKPGDPCNCPLWHAINRALNDHEMPHDKDRLAFVGPAVSIKLTEWETARFVVVPREASEWMIRFDNRLHVSPMLFRLNLDDYCPDFEWIR